jgi:predicted nuclease of restriction endonuclease-like (RecB) superfamily
MADKLMAVTTADFDGVIDIIEKARNRAFHAVNQELINMYWEIGKYVSDRIANNTWGKSIVEDFADFIEKRYVGIKGFSASNIWRMKQFYETYRDNVKLAPLVRELSWTHNLQIMSCKKDEEREFYLTLTIENHYSRRDLKRQMDSGLYERTRISNVRNKLIVKNNDVLNLFRDSYAFEFFDLPLNHKEKDLRKAIVGNLKKFILEFGKDFTFIDDEYRIQVGNRDFFIDLLFFNRKLRCLVAIELKIGEFEPEHLGKMEFYLEALDRNVKKADENPSVGLILCTKKDMAVVEYSLSRSLSPALIADYKLYLPDKKILENKLNELIGLVQNNNEKEGK